MPSVTYRRPGLVARDHVFRVPLCHDDPGAGEIEVFGREVVAPGKEDQRLPWLVYFQGGPGGKAERPVSTSAWLGRALQDHRVLLLDQRGTGRSTPANRQSLAGMSPAEQAEHLSHLRADSIVRDAEAIRAELVGDEPWTVLGQSFGGFCALTYLSLAPQGLRQVLITGGIPTLTGHADDVYRAAYPRTLRKNDAYFARYPHDAEIARRVVEHLAEHEVRMPTGERLTPERFQTLGIQLGQAGQFDALHYLLEEAFLGDTLSDTFLRGVDAVVSFAPRPLYAVLHESIYCQGTASRWSAHRVRAEFPEFDWTTAERVNFTGEMIYPWMFEQDPALVPLREAADLLAAKDDWPALYDLDQLARNEVPVAAAVYHDDMYVDRDHALESAERVRGARVWVTNEYEHDGVKASPAVLDRLLAMNRGDA
ncbi:alpha/beta fold hydrolase [Saccharopolyspora hordei]|uniref:Pimeloyl-ACP methyl ester carboxylesterase n=1 Tax=Saccharopolyspora hordei TaxID=1838 RepID=A0A853ASJ3_9PSEU|nr:alpha/beta fold hydrolase [Saccharopolyspora hordei]NYI85170.1 pimeloyl-ACP methyl ester carboxylesterase [Saccharopolyspora hordei]